MEFTQPLAIGQGLVLGLNLQDSHPVSMRAQPHMHATINEMWENSWGSGDSNGISAIPGNLGTHKKRANNMQMRHADKLQQMTS